MVHQDIVLPPVAEDVGRFGNAYYRWTLLYAVLIFVIATWPLWMTIIAPDQASIVNSLFLVVFAAVWVSIAFNALNNLRKLGTVKMTDIKGIEAARKRKFKHIVVVPCYLDPIEVLFDCLGSLLMQDDAKSLLVVVAFEAKTPDLLMKEQSVRNAFKDRFQHLLITIHTVDRAKEIAGGCSNKNYALRSAHAHIQAHPEIYANQAITVTTCDTDSLFHPTYFQTLEMVYNEKNPTLGNVPVMCVWQSPLFYNWDLDERPFFNRVTCLMRSMMMLGGLISFDLNPMSVFSYPIELGVTAGFINPRYGVDDIIAKVRWMCANNSQVPVELLPIPSISGPTIGLTMYQEYEEWSRQIRRWIIGSSESFHYFLIHFRGQPFVAGVSWFAMFFMYYAVLLCCAGINSLLTGIPYPWIQYSELSFGNGFTVSLSYAGLAFLLLQYIVFAVAFYIDWRVKIMMRIEEKSMTWYRNLFHWLSAPWVLLWYSIIAFCSIISFTWKGKKMARHDMAAKDGLEKRKDVVISGNKKELNIKEVDESTVTNTLHIVGIVENEKTMDEETNSHSDKSMKESDPQEESLYMGLEEEPQFAHHRTTSVTRDQQQGHEPGRTASTTAATLLTATLSSPSNLYPLPERFYFGTFAYVVPNHPGNNNAQPQV